METLPKLPIDACHVRSRSEPKHILVHAYTYDSIYVCDPGERYANSACGRICGLPVGYPSTPLPVFVTTPVICLYNSRLTRFGMTLQIQKLIMLKQRLAAFGRSTSAAAAGAGRRPRRREALPPIKKKRRRQHQGNSRSGNRGGGGGTRWGARTRWG